MLFKLFAQLLSDFSARFIKRKNLSYGYDKKNSTIRIVSNNSVQKVELESQFATQNCLGCYLNEFG